MHNIELIFHARQLWIKLTSSKPSHELQHFSKKFLKIHLKTMLQSNVSNKVAKLKSIFAACLGRSAEFDFQNYWVCSW